MPDKNTNRFEDFEKDSLYAIMAETEKLAEVGGWAHNFQMRGRRSWPIKGLSGGTRNWAR